MSNQYFDYIILTVTNPAFEVNIGLMIDTIIESGGTSPTIINKIQHPMVGTKESNGRIMLHFRLNQRYENAALVAFLETGMNAPRPPISVESSRSAKKTIWIDDGLDGEGNPIGHYEYEVLEVAKKANLLTYMADVVDYYNSNGGPVMRPPNAGDTIHLSGYYGCEPIEPV